MSTPNLAILIRPIDFDFNEETSTTNSFQNKAHANKYLMNEVANEEFNKLVNKLIKNRINVCVLSEKKTEIKKPDAVFSNNWVVYMPSGHIYTMPMFAKNRQAEVDQSLILGNNYSFFETYKNEPLEGTGSMVFDHKNKKIYAAISPRTHQKTLSEFSRQVKYEVIDFKTSDSSGNPVYHTNVVMAMGENWVVVCKDVISDVDWEHLQIQFIKDNKQVITITEKQMKHFCGNIFELKNSDDDLCTVMSKTAYKAFKRDQIDSLTKWTKLIITDVNNIERVGGGGVRCMITGSFV